MRNRGIDFSIGYRGTLGEQTSYSVTSTAVTTRTRSSASTIRGAVVLRSNPTRLTNHVINQVGSRSGRSMGTWRRYFASAAEIAALDAAAQAKTGNPAAKYQAGEAPGRLRFRDVNGDGVVNSSDFTIIGSPIRISPRAWISLCGGAPGT